MTTAAQRIWEAIYAAEFVHQVHAHDWDKSDDLMAEADDTAGQLAGLHGHRASEHGARFSCVPTQPVSRFRKRSR